MERASKEKFNAAIAHLEHRSPESLRAELKDILETLRDGNDSAPVVEHAVQPDTSSKWTAIALVAMAVIVLLMMR